MLNPALPLQASSTAPPRPLRWIALCAGSVLFHWIALSMATSGFGSMAPKRAPPHVMTATLRPAPPAPADTPTVVEAAPTPNQSKPMPVKKSARPKPALTAASAVANPAAGPDANPSVAEPAPIPASIDPALALALAEPAGPAEATSAPLVASADAATPAATLQTGDTPNPDRAPRYTVNLPPPATLDYEVRYTTRGNITSGSSRIDWLPGDGGYAIRGEVSKFGFALSTFRSEGTIDDAGIAPTLYAEKNARRAETNTHFQRKAAPVISFSAATDSFPLLTGAQDRASILWQLSGIARGDRRAFVEGAVLDVFVAGVRDAEHWLIKIVGEETVTLETGQARAWHLVRTPRAGTYDKRIDIWLASDQQWYPVKLRYTEVNGDYLDLSLSAVRPAGAR